MKLKVIVLWCFVILSSYVEGLRFFSHGRLRGGSFGGSVEDDPLPPDEWFTQPLDHFNPQDNRTWKQRYFTNSSLYEKGGPVFLMVGGEGEASAEWMTKGAWVEYAKSHKALLYQLEHRFYGKSRPTEDLSVKSLRFLSSEQALSDLAAFADAMGKQLEKKTGSKAKWVLFGGSYPGSLAAWARARYPHLFHSAVSASGPLIAVEDFQDFFKVVTTTLAKTSQGCFDAVASAREQLGLMLKHRVGQQTASKMFQLCDPINADNTRDLLTLYQTLSDNFAGIVQYNKDKRISKDPAKNITVDVACNIMTDESHGIALRRMAALSNLLLKAHNLTCLDYTYDSQVKELSNESWSGESAEGGRQWVYQTCTEFGFFQTSTRNDTQQLFGEFPLSLFESQCVDAFGPEFTPELLRRGIDRTNTEYGALNFKADRVVFVHGTVDPWHVLGITQNLGPLTPAILIEGTAHCADMYPASDDDPPQLRAAREKISNLLKQWLQLP